MQQEYAGNRHFEVAFYVRKCTYSTQNGVGQNHAQRLNIHLASHGRIFEYTIALFRAVVTTHSNTSLRKNVHVCVKLCKCLPFSYSDMCIICI